eukprot:TRINITY_DN48496_c0_g1_i1.p1 TRINITY_DN48496_c0_g1~~TRINITY_DN48496_c0_g1_i1.p1  ORF type:complete len:365 (-),score=59.23 TRINITY_DN48496_c0_g1_i1:363-1457(-)
MVALQHQTGDADEITVKLEDSMSDLPSPVLPERDPSPAEVGERGVVGAEARWDPIRHFKHQVALIRQLIPAPRGWDVFMGSLGTGIVGVRERRVRRNTKTEDPSAPPFAGLPRSSAKTRMSTQPDVKVRGTYVVLFLNGKTAKLQEWNGRSMSGFSSGFNRDKKVLTWESQRYDKKGRIIAKILENVKRGVEIVVAVRGSPGDTYRILGRTLRFRLKAPARFLVNKGEHVLVERGSSRVHKAILAQCLDAGLKAGVGLLPIRYPLAKDSNTTYCSACCWAPATAVLTFNEYDKEAATIFEGGKPDSVTPKNVKLVGKQRTSCADKKVSAARKRLRRSLCKSTMGSAKKRRAASLTGIVKPEKHN